MREVLCRIPNDETKRIDQKYEKKREKKCEKKCERKIALPF